MAYHTYLSYDGDPLAGETELKKRLKKAAASKKGDVAEPAPELALASKRYGLYGGGPWPSSTDRDWREYKGRGWVHATELSRFELDHVLCIITNLWFLKIDCEKVVDQYAIGKWVSKVNMEAAGWGMCQFTKRACLKVNLAEAYDDRDKKIMVEKEHRAALFFKYKNGRHYHGDSAVTLWEEVDDAPVKEVHPRWVLNETPSCRCEGCNKDWKNQFVVERQDIGLDYHGVKLCPICYIKKIGQTAIREHNYNGYPSPLGKKYKHYHMGMIVEKLPKRLYGIEVETEMNRAAVSKIGLDRWKMAMMVKKCLGTDFVIVKEDGTLTENGKYSEEGNKFAGFEVVTAPADMDTMRERWMKLVDMTAYKHLRAWDTVTCGLHIHVTREALTTLQIGRIIAFTTHPTNKAFIQKVAGRGEMKFCAYHPKKVTSSLVTEHKSDETRRVAVNTTNPKTIEFRIFRGTVNPKHILRNLEFVDALCTYCYPATRSLQELFTDDGFVKFVIEGRKIDKNNEQVMAWPLLAAWMVANSMGDKSKLIGPVEAVEENGDHVGPPKGTPSSHDPLGLRLVRDNAYAAKKVAKAEVKAQKQAVAAPSSVVSDSTF